MKIIPPQNLSLLCEKLHSDGAAIVLVQGVFDLLHPGHIDVLKKARTLGSHLIVALDSDASARQRKGKNRPITPLEERAEILAALEMVTFVTWMDEQTREQVLRQIRPAHLVNGDEQTARIVQSMGGKIVNLPILSEYGTSKIIDRITRLPDISK